MRAVAVLLALMLSSPVLAGFPPDYRKLSLEQALAASAKDGKPVMIFFTHET